MGEKVLMPGVNIKRILVEEDARPYGLTQRILNRLPNVPVEPVSRQGPVESLRHLDAGKETLYLSSHRGNLLKPCPGTKEYICCGYQILNLAANCPLDCSYCILQFYFLNQPYLRIFANLEDRLGHFLNVIDNESGQIFRIGTGEFTDSLALDHITHWSDLLLPQFSRRKNAVLELKTKTTRINRLLASRYRDRIIVSWSLNSSQVSAREEREAATIKKRLEAAKRCQDEGFTLGFHFDPLVHHPDWRDGYVKTIELMDKYIDPRGIIWISMGSLRFMPGLKPIIRKRHPKSTILNGEFIVGLDGKVRYFKAIRTDLYYFMREQLEKWYPDLGLYLCMESDEVWQTSMGWTPETSAGLCHYLDRRVLKFFG
ncbi:MAG: DNA photolyase [Pseudomonadota bacterium]